MTNLDLILESIKNKAEEEKNQILEKAKEEASKLLEESDQKADKEAEVILDDARKDKDLTISNEELSSSRKARDIKIAAKNDLINKVIGELLDRLQDLDENSYKKFVLNRLKDFDAKDYEIVLKESMKDAFSKEELKGLTISKESTEDGFIIKDNNVTYDNSFSSIIDYEKDEIKKIISDALFTKEEI